MSISSQGPWIKTAAICEKVLQEQDGILSLIRIVDRVTQTYVGPEPPSTMPPIEINLWAVIVLTPDEARGRHAIKVRPEKPSGEQLVAYEMSALFEGEERGAGLVLQLQLTLDQEGLYWFDVILDDAQQTLLSRMPLRLIYQPQKIVTG